MNYSSLGVCILISIFGVACTADVYVPTPHQTHLLEDRGDFKINGNKGESGLNLQIAYAISNSIGFGVYGTMLDKEFENDFESGNMINDDFQKHKYLEGALIFNPFENKNFHLEMLLSYGIGQGEELKQYESFNRIEENYGYGEYDKYSFQTNIAFKKGILEVGFSPKISYLNYDELIQRGNQDFGSDTKKGWFWEPGSFLRLGGELLKVEFQFGSTEALEEVGFGYETGYYSIGIQLSLDTLKK